MIMNSTSLNFTHRLFRNYFYEKFGEFFIATDEVKETILNELWEKSKVELEENDNKVGEDEKHNWDISYHTLDNEGIIPFFHDIEVILIELPKPKLTGEAYYLCLGIGSPPKEYYVIMPIYMMIEYYDENNAYFGGYIFEDENDMKHFYNKKPVEISINNIILTIANRMQQFKYDEEISIYKDNNCNEHTSTNYNVGDHIMELDGMEFGYIS
jgi:hypothetical protein